MNPNNTKKKLRISFIHHATKSLVHFTTTDHSSNNIHTNNDTTLCDQMSAATLRFSLNNFPQSKASVLNKNDEQTQMLNLLQKNRTPHDD